jgi:3-methyladenine DNA glycosylase AlkD
MFPGMKPLKKDIENLLRQMEQPERALFLKRFFKTGPGEYAEGDLFLGLKVPEIRKLSREFREIDLAEVFLLLKSPYHEARHLALMILIHQYKKGGTREKEQIFRGYLKLIRHINNWDLVDISAEHIIGAHLDGKDLSLLKRLAVSKSMWERRIAILSTFFWTRRNEFRPVLEIARILRQDPEDLIQKGVGWMLREVGNRDLASERNFLDVYYRQMPRTMLRYAIEKFSPGLRQSYLKGTI